MQQFFQRLMKARGTSDYRFMLFTYFTGSALQGEIGRERMGEEFLNLYRQAQCDQYDVMIDFYSHLPPESQRYFISKLAVNDLIRFGAILRFFFEDARKGVFEISSLELVERVAEMYKEATQIYA